MVRLLLGTIGWIVCVVYSTIPSFWLMIHPRAGYWRSRSWSPYRALLPLWIAMWLGFALVTVRWRSISLYAAPWAWIPGALLFATGVWLYSQSSREFSAKQLGGVPEILPGLRQQQLVTAGIRSRVRHPVYLAHLCEMLAWSLGTGLAVCYALTTFAVLTGMLMLRLEDQELEQRFGEEYRKYRSAVPAVVPRVF